MGPQFLRGGGSDGGGGFAGGAWGADGGGPGAKSCFSSGTRKSNEGRGVRDACTHYRRTEKKQRFSYQQKKYEKLLFSMPHKIPVFPKMMYMYRYSTKMKTRDTFSDATQRTDGLGTNAATSLTPHVVGHTSPKS